MENEGGITTATYSDHPASQDCTLPQQFPVLANFAFGSPFLIGCKGLLLAVPGSTAIITRAMIGIC
jgi:hypothetical protein